MRQENLECRHKLRERNGRIPLQPLLILLRIFHKDEEVVNAALVMDFGLGAFAAGHFESNLSGVLVFEMGKMK